PSAASFIQQIEQRSSFGQIKSKFYMQERSIHYGKNEILSKQMRSLYGDNMVHCSLCVNKDCEHRDELDGGCYASRERTDYEIYLWYAWEFGRWSLAKVVKTKKKS
ncbi:MAG: hypothetical protein K2F81_09555, partial [Ruminococcus sp.]|nr:hypothetical protein [Ruminococcus sp.]